MTGPRHPWLAEFVDAPPAVFGQLLAGYARVAPYDRADAPDIARLLFGALAPDDPARAALGPAILAWLEERRRQPVPAAPGKRQRWLREICEAFEIVALLEVTGAAVALRRGYLIWNDWLADKAPSPARDARAQYWRMLALTQRLVTRAAPGIDGWSLSPLWQRLCREAGGPLPERYLDLGLLGLRYLPDHDFGSEAPWLSGLAQWALARKPSDAAFKAAWLALKPLYPRAPLRWRKLVGTVLATPMFEAAGIEPPGWWGSDPDFDALKRHPPAASDRLRSPYPRDCERVVSRFGEPFDRVEPEIERLMNDHRRYLRATGDSRFMVKAIHALGQALITGGGDAPLRRAGTAQALAREGLEWAPGDVYLWSLWRDALAAAGAFQAAEMVGWVSVWRIPEDVDGRTQLATLLATALNRPEDAEALLKDTLLDFPENIYARNQLAEVLIAGDRIGEAAAVVDQAFARGRVDAVTYALRARLYGNSGRPQEALAAVRRGLEMDPSNPVLKLYRKLIEDGRPLLLKSSSSQRPAPQGEPAADPGLDQVLRYGQVRRLRLWMGSQDAQIRDAGIAALKDLMDDPSPLPYAALLAARHGLWRAGADTLPPLAVAFEAALAVGDRARLDELATRQGRLEALILVAQAVLGDPVAAGRVEAWLRRPGGGEEERPAAVLRAGLAPVLRLIEGGRSVAQALEEERTRVLRALHDANEVSLAA